MMLPPAARLKPRRGAQADRAGSEHALELGAARLAAAAAQATAAAQLEEAQRETLLACARLSTCSQDLQQAQQRAKQLERQLQQAQQEAGGLAGQLSREAAAAQELQRQAASLQEQLREARQAAADAAQLREQVAVQQVVKGITDKSLQVGGRVAGGGWVAGRTRWAPTPQWAPASSCLAGSLWRDGPHIELQGKLRDVRGMGMVPALKRGVPCIGACPPPPQDSNTGLASLQQQLAEARRHSEQLQAGLAAAELGRRELLAAADAGAGERQSLQQRLEGLGAQVQQLQEELRQQQEACRALQLAQAVQTTRGRDAQVGALVGAQCM
jgi:hypothetical protein